jgi:iron complex outermembrane receptor protein
MSYRAKLRTGLLSATIFTSTALTTPALAQQAQEAAADQDANTIIVTGTRRSTTIMEAPINISAVGADEIARQRIDDVRDLADFTPGLTISDTGPGSTGTIVLRGLSASDTDVGRCQLSMTRWGVYLGEVPLYYDFKLLDIDARRDAARTTGHALRPRHACRRDPQHPEPARIPMRSKGEAHGSFYGKEPQRKDRLSGRRRHQHPDR